MEHGRSKFDNKLRKWSRSIHRDLSFFFAGVLLIYATSGFMLNHKRDFNSSYAVETSTTQLAGNYPATSEGWTKEDCVRSLTECGEGTEFLKFYQPDADRVKIFVRRGCTLEINTKSGKAVFETLRKRPILSSLNRLHYNPSRWWTIFSDIFLVSLVVIVISGLICIKGPKGLWGRGGIELLCGILIPILFMFLA